MLCILYQTKNAMQLGDLDRRVVIEKPTATADTYGQRVDVWTTHATVWARMAYESGDETYEAEQKVATRIVKFFVRYDAAITERMRVSFESALYDILAVEQISRKRFMVLKTQKKDSQ